MPKKTKTVENKTQPSADSASQAVVKKAAKPRSGRDSNSPKKPRSTRAAKRTADQNKPVSASQSGEPSPANDISEDTIRLRAYFISERRRRLALSGDAESDWLEAKRQLDAEAQR